MPFLPPNQQRQSTEGKIPGERGTAHIRPPHAPDAERCAAIDRYLLPAGPTAANLQQRVCRCVPVLRQTDGQRDERTVGLTPDNCIDPAMRRHTTPALGSAKTLTLETIICSCFVGYISAPTYYLLLEPQLLAGKAGKIMKQRLKHTYTQLQVTVK